MWCFAHRPFNLFVPFVPDQDDAVSLLCELNRFKVDFGDQRTSCINDAQIFLPCHLPDRWRNAVSAEDDGRAVWNFVKFVDEDDASLFKVLNDKSVVDYFLADINWRRQKLEHSVHYLNCPDNPRAKTAWGSQDNPFQFRQL
jgi:hypothetical protein